MLYLFCNDQILLTATHELPHPSDPCVAALLRTAAFTIPFDGGHIAAQIPLTPHSSLLIPHSPRACHALFPPEEYRRIVKAAELLAFRRTHRYCSACGAEVEHVADAAPHLHCPACGREEWPCINPAVIVRITRGDEILLVQARNFRRPYYGLVAGFVETGESAEEALIREVREETNLEIKNLRYFASQPWPFPHTLMLGYTAEYASGTLRLQEEELRAGGWFHRDALPAIPDAASLARRLIDAWL